MNSLPRKGCYMNLSSEKNEIYQSSELQENLEILRQTYFFSGLPLEKLKVFAYVCTRETFNKGEYLFRQGDDDGQGFYILSGKVSLVHMDNGGERIIRDFDAGEFLGGMALLCEVHRLFSLKALTEVTCLILSRERFRSTIQQFPDLMPRIIAAVVKRVSAWDERFLVSRDESYETSRQHLGVSLI
jgi:CRP/FNR family cyclic AMP-dependent transcriptional regulator